MKMDSTPAVLLSTSFAGEPEIRASRRAKLGLYAISLGFALVLLDTSALNVAIVAMQRDFGGSISKLQWVVNSYTVVFASFLLACGAMADRFGVRRFYQGGLAFFTVMSLACALSPSLGFLIGTRVFQGLGAAILLPASLSLLSHAFPHPEERAHAVAFWASVVSLAFAAGPALGGIMTSWLGWRSIFAINVPLGVLTLVLVAGCLDEAKTRATRRIDWLGQGLAALALFGLTYGLIEAGELGWAAPRVLVSIGVAVALLLTFLWWDRRSETPVLPQSLFGIPTFAVSVGTGLALNFGMYGVLFTISIYLQEVQKMSVLATGLMILPFSMLPTITARFINRFNGRRYIRRRMATGLTVAAAGALALWLALSQAQSWSTLPGLALLGVGMGLIMPAMTSGVLTSAPTPMAGMASGILNAARQVGGALGVALMGTLVHDRLPAGFAWCYALTALCFLGMAGITLRAIAEFREPATV